MSVTTGRIGVRHLATSLHMNGQWKWQTSPWFCLAPFELAVGTIWRALSKPPQRRQGPDLRPLWLLVGTPSAIRPDSLSAGRSIACPIRMSLYIFLHYIYHLCFTCIDFYNFSAWGGCLFVVYIRRFIYKFLNVCPFDYTAVAGSGKVGPVNQVNHTSWAAVVTPTDRPKSVRNRCVIELFCGVVCVVTLPFWQFCWCRGFCHRTESDLFLFLLTLKNGPSMFILFNIWPNLTFFFFLLLMVYIMFLTIYYICFIYIFSYPIMGTA